jgi:hypothetical protein
MLSTLFLHRQRHAVAARAGTADERTTRCHYIDTFVTTLSQCPRALDYQAHSSTSLPPMAL